MLPLAILISLATPKFDAPDVYPLIMSAKCDVACKYESYSGGFWIPVKSKCRCFDDYEARDILLRKLPRSAPRASTSESL